MTGEGIELVLTSDDVAVLEGRDGPAAACGMRIVVAMAKVSGARELVDVTQAHIDACLFHGQAGLDFAELLAGQGGRVRVPTTLNVSLPVVNVSGPTIVPAAPRVSVNGPPASTVYGEVPPVFRRVPLTIKVLPATP